jgi:hypothetical protein
MRLAKRNKQKMFYSLCLGEVPIYDTDDDGNIRYVEIDGEKKPVETGEKEIRYSETKELYSSKAMSGGEAEAKEFGLTTADYDCTLLCAKGEYPLTEGAVIWDKSEIVYVDEDETNPDRTSADYEVIKVSESLNLVKYVLKALTK